MLTIDLFAFVPIVKFLLGVSNVSVPWDTLILSVVLFVVIPLTGGMLTRSLVIGKHGKSYLEGIFVNKFDGITTIGLLLTLLPWQLLCSARHLRQRWRLQSVF